MDPYQHIVLSLYRDLFAAREDAYVQDSRVHVNKPLTTEVISDALTTGHSISGYMAVGEAGVFRTMVGAVDLDEGSLDDGRRVRDVLSDHGIASLLVQSRRGMHLWTWHRGSGAHDTANGSLVPANTVREALRAACVLSGLPAHAPKPNSANKQWCLTCDEPVHRHVEVFPKDSGKPWGVGALRMPLMPHPKSGEVYPAFDMEDRKITKVRDLVNEVRDYTAPWESVWKLAGGTKITVPYPTDLGSYRQRTKLEGPAPVISALLATLGLTAEAGHSVRCPFHPDGKASLSIARDDERAFCKSPTCDLYGDGRGMGSLQLRAYLERTPVHG